MPPKKKVTKKIGTKTRKPTPVSEPESANSPAPPQPETPAKPTVTADLKKILATVEPLTARDHASIPRGVEQLKSAILNLERAGL